MANVIVALGATAIALGLLSWAFNGLVAWASQRDRNRWKN